MIFMQAQICTFEQKVSTTRRQAGRCSNFRRAAPRSLSHARARARESCTGRSLSLLCYKQRPCYKGLDQRQLSIVAVAVQMPGKTALQS